MPRSSSLSLRNVSASSINSVGRNPSTTRKIALAETLAAGNGRSTSCEITSSAVVLPQPRVGDVIASRGEIIVQSSRKV